MIIALAIGALFLLAIALVPVAFGLIDRGLDRRPLFADAASLSGPSRDWYRQLNPKAPLPPEPAPFPGDEPVQAAPAAEPEPEPGGQDDDTVWRRHGIGDDVWARLRAEVKS